ncbi:MAG: 30S ribosomal protein S5 [Patescibacteria group bacterium]
MFISSQAKWDYKVLEVKRVTRVTAGGKRFKIRTIVISGDMNGLVGVGIGKGDDIAQAVEKARKQAEKNAIRVVIKNETIPYQVEGKSGASRVLVKPAPKGTGVKAGGSVRIVLDLAGVSNASSKILGRTRNKLVNTLACLEALKKLNKYKSHNKEENVNTPDTIQE